jgi:hypothetical protein
VVCVLGRISNVCTTLIKTDYVGHNDVRGQLKLCNEGVWERGTPRTLNLGSRCWQVGSFRPGNFMEYKTVHGLEPLWTVWTIRCRKPVLPVATDYI